MRTLTLVYVALASVAILGCGTKVIDLETPPPQDAPGTGCDFSELDVSAAFSNSGYAWKVDTVFGVPADISAALRRSPLRLFEDGRELGPAHAAHVDIRGIGLGQFSHWSNGTTESLYFSASDNTSPRTNGRRYSTCVGP